MRRQSTLPHEILKFVPWARFESSVETHRADKHVRTLPTKSQFVALLYAQLAGATSLREIEASIKSQHSRLYHLGIKAPKRSTLADANAQRPAEVFAEMFGMLLAQGHRGLRKHANEAIRLIDSSLITLNALSRGWAHYDTKCDSVKMHIVYDPDAAVRVHFAVSPARENDMVQANAVPIEEGAAYVFDKGYPSFTWWAKLHAAECRFVTRLRTNSPTAIIEERPVAKGGKITIDRIVRVRSRLGHTRKSPLDCNLREVHVVIDTGKTLRLVSNDLTATAEEIADLYKTRWEIELFFRWVKQTLKIRKFLGTSENAVRVQIAVALIAYLLLRLAHAAQAAVPSMLTFARLVRANLMHYRSFADLTDPDGLDRRYVPDKDQLLLC